MKRLITNLEEKHHEKYLQSDDTFYLLTNNGKRLQNTIIYKHGTGESRVKLSSHGSMNPTHKEWEFSRKSGHRRSSVVSSNGRKAIRFRQRDRRTTPSKIQTDNIC